MQLVQACFDKLAYTVAINGSFQLEHQLGRHASAYKQQQVSYEGRKYMGIGEQFVKLVHMVLYAPVSASVAVPLCATF